MNEEDRKRFRKFIEKKTGGRRKGPMPPNQGPMRSNKQGIEDSIRRMRRPQPRK